MRIAPYTPLSLSFILINTPARKRLQVKQTSESSKTTLPFRRGLHSGRMNMLLVLLGVALAPRGQPDADKPALAAVTVAATARAGLRA